MIAGVRSLRVHSRRKGDESSEEDHVCGRQNRPGSARTCRSAALFRDYVLAGDLTSCRSGSISDRRSGRAAATEGARVARDASAGVTPAWPSGSYQRALTKPGYGPMG